MKLTATKRTVQGTSASRRLRREGNVPGIIYGDGDAQSVTFDHNHLWHTMRRENALTSILEIDIEGKKTKVITRDVHYHVYKPFIMHIDFQRVNMKQKLTMSIPISYINADESPAIKQHSQVLNYIYNELEIECLPSDLPENIEVDLINLPEDGSISLSDITLPKGVEITQDFGDEENPVFLMAAHVAEEVIEEDEVEAAEGDTAEAPAAEGDAEEAKED